MSRTRPVAARVRPLIAATAALFVAGLVVAAAASAARISVIQRSGGETVYLYWAAPGEVNRLTVVLAQFCPDCEQSKITFRGSPRPTQQRGLGCAATAAAITCVTAADEQVEGVRAFLGDRSDTANGIGLPYVTLFGMAGNDRLTGSAVVGGLGNDTLTGTAARDSVSGGVGNDLINTAGGGADVVTCGTGIDTVRADRFDRLSGCERVTRV